jgi:CRP/FNR family cyclic AMP-dependent transcriptional regulator
MDVRGGSLAMARPPEGRNEQMIERFRGTAGKRLRVEAIRQQQIVENNTALAKKLDAVAKLMQLEAVAPKNVCIKQGATDNDLYLILSGKVSVCVHGREVAIRHASQHVGEMALLDPGKSRCATVSALETTVVARISEASFGPIANKHPKLWRALAVELADRLRERNKHVKAPNPRPVIFIGSSAEKRHIAFEIRDGLSHENMLPKVWTDDLFRPSATSIENLERELEASDFAVMAVTPDDMVISRHKKKAAPRDNVLWEHGLFLGGLGRKRVYIVKPRGADLKLPSDLLGVTPLDFDPVGTADDLRARLGSAINSIRKEVERLGPR